MQRSRWTLKRDSSLDCVPNLCRTSRNNDVINIMHISVPETRMQIRDIIYSAIYRFHVPCIIISLYNCRTNLYSKYMYDHRWWCYIPAVGAICRYDVYVYNFSIVIASECCAMQLWCSLCICELSCCKILKCLLLFYVIIYVSLPFLFIFTRRITIIRNHKRLLKAYCQCQISVKNNSKTLANFLNVNSLSTKFVHSEPIQSIFLG